jgi:peroxiredoxin family protein
MCSQYSETSTHLNKDLLIYIDNRITAEISEKLKSIREEFERSLAACRRSDKSQLSNRVTIVAFSGDMDKLMAALIIATGAVAMDMNVSIYFTFWSLAALKKKTNFKGKSFSDKLTTLMLPSGPKHLGTSRMNMLGVGPAFFNKVMKRKNLLSLPEMINLAHETGVRIIACQTAMEVMGITKEELIDGLDYGGVTTYLADARDSKVTLFI